MGDAAPTQKSKAPQRHLSAVPPAALPPTLPATPSRNRLSWMQSKFGAWKTESCLCARTLLWQFSQV